MSTTTNTETPKTPTSKIPSVSAPLEIIFPTQKPVVFTPTPTLRGETPWNYPYPAEVEKEGLAKFKHFLDVFGEKFVTDIFLDGLTSHCQLKWRAASAADNPIETFIRNFFRSRREMGLTSVKLRKQMELTQVEFRKAAEAKATKEELKVLMAKYQGLKQQMEAKTLEEANLGISVEDLQREEEEEGEGEDEK